MHLVLLQGILLIVSCKDRLSSDDMSSSVEFAANRIMIMYLLVEIFIGPSCDDGYCCANRCQLNFAFVFSSVR